MKIKIIITALGAAATCLQINSANNLQNAISVFDTAQGYEAPGVATAEYAKYKSIMSQIATNIANKDYEGLGTNVTAAHSANADSLLENLFDGGPLSLANLKAAGFTKNQIQDLGQDAGLSYSEAVLYANQGLSADSNYENITNMFWNGISATDATQVASALKLLNTDDYANDPFIAQVKAELTDPYSSFNEGLTSAKFSPDQIKQICESAGIDAETTGQIYELNTFFDNSINKLGDYIKSGNAESVSDLLTSMAAAKPNLTAELFQNGEPLDKATLSNFFPKTADLTTILQSARLQTADITNYLAGNYTGPSSIPSGPSGPFEPVTPKGGNTLYEEIYQQSLEAYKGLSLQNINSLEATYRAQAATIKAEMSTINEESAEYQEYQNELDTASARAQAASDAAAAEGGDVPVDPVG